MRPVNTMSPEPEADGDLEDLLVSDLRDLSRKLKDKFSDCFQLHKKICKGYEKIAQKKEEENEELRRNLKVLSTNASDAASSGQKGFTKASTSATGGDVSVLLGRISEQDQKLQQLQEQIQSLRSAEPTALGHHLDNSSVSHTSPGPCTQPTAHRSPSPELGSVTGPNRPLKQHEKRPAPSRKTVSVSPTPSASNPTSSSDQTFAQRKVSISTTTSRRSTTESASTGTNSSFSKASGEGSPKSTNEAVSRPFRSRGSTLRSGKRLQPDESVGSNKKPRGQFRVSRKLSLRPHDHSN